MKRAYLWFLMPVSYLIGVRWLFGSVLSIDTIFGLVFIAAVVYLSMTEWGFWVASGAGVVSGILYYFFQNDFFAAVILFGLFVFLLGLISAFYNSFSPIRSTFLYVPPLALAAGIVPVLIDQIEGWFSEEEFFVALQALILVGMWVSIWAAKQFSGLETSTGSISGRNLRSPWTITGYMLAGVVVVWVAATAYKSSFYPLEAPPYDGVTDSSPFLCAPFEASEPPVDGIALHQQILSQIEANPNKRLEEFGALAVGTGELLWAERFRDAILKEAKEEAFTQPANSVKFDQYLASLRLYYYDAVVRDFPELFSAGEKEVLIDWFAAINDRALTVEWVDWFYGFAYDKPAEGPYENQENGMGLLAQLQRLGFAGADLSLENEILLAEGPGGWDARFRNSDDSLLYQGDWILNAYYQAQDRGFPDSNTMRLSFDWLLHQALPDGAPFGYNHPAPLPLANVSYLGASLLNDPRYIWLAGKSVEYLKENQLDFYVLPGIEKPVDLTGTPPSTGTCLLYGDTGLPTQNGPLGPDKIVFRDGWADDSAYLLLNLRFTGWHRYKATNAVIALYKDGPLVVEDTAGDAFDWLPEGRSAFRDKRIPRENLNGLLIEKSGMSAVLYSLTGMGSAWAQDPPHFAQVSIFENTEDADISQTELVDWRGWNHQRTIHFEHDTFVVVEDFASGPAGKDAAITWHVTGATGRSNRTMVREGDHPVEMVILGSGRIVFDDDESPVPVTFYSDKSGGVDVTTVFLFDEWVGAEILFVGDTIRIENGTEFLEIPRTKVPR